MHDKPIGAAHEGATTAAQDVRDRARVLREVLDLYPETLTHDELVRELTVDSVEFQERDSRPASRARPDRRRPDSSGRRSRPAHPGGGQLPRARRRLNRAERPVRSPSDDQGSPHPKQQDRWNQCT